MPRKRLLGQVREYGEEPSFYLSIGLVSCVLAEDALLLYPFQFKNLKKKGILKMKKTILASISLTLVLLLCLCSCSTVDAEGLWEDATYRRDMEFGEGETTVQVEVRVDESSVTFTISTDKDTLGDALTEHGLLEGEQGPYGLYVKKVNGITADADVGGAYWALYKNGEFSMTGVDTTPIADGEHYELVYSK